jgi:hypothetical protein
MPEFYESEMPIDTEREKLNNENTNGGFKEKKKISKIIPIPKIHVTFSGVHMAPNKEDEKREMEERYVINDDMEYNVAQFRNDLIITFFSKKRDLPEKFILAIDDGKENNLISCSHFSKGDRWDCSIENMTRDKFLYHSNKELRI